MLSSYFLFLSLSSNVTLLINTVLLLFIFPGTCILRRRGLFSLAMNL